MILRYFADGKKHSFMKKLKENFNKGCQQGYIRTLRLAAAKAKLYASIE